MTARGTLRLGLSALALIIAASALRSGELSAQETKTGGAGGDPLGDLAVDQFEKKINEARKKAVEYLLKQQKDTWRVVTLIDQNMAVRDGAARFQPPGAYAIIPPGWFDPEPLGDIDVLNAGGTTGLVTLALLSAGLSPGKEPKVAKALDCLSNIYTADLGGQVTLKIQGKAIKQGMQGTYALCVQAAALELAFNKDANPARKASYRKQITSLGAKIQAGYRADGGYDYVLKGSDRWDMSNTQYAVLALAAVHEVTGEVSTKTLTHLNNFYLNTQTGEGGWPYSPTSGSNMNMTAGAVSSLMMVIDMLHTRGITRPTVNPFNRESLAGKSLHAAHKGLEYFGRNYKLSPDGYLMYSTERIGASGGYKRFGVSDWYREGVEILLRTQGADGSWAPPEGLSYKIERTLNTAFCLLFLVHGNSPVWLNKLRWGGENEYGWHNYPRDAANLTRWHNKTFESNAAWQIVEFRTSQDFDDAPILYVNGAANPAFNDVQVDELKRHIERGGTIVAVPAGNGKDFVDAMMGVGRRMYPPEDFPEYQWQLMQPDHPVYNMRTGEDHIKKIKSYHMHNGSRSFFFVFPEDIAFAWNMGKSSGKEEMFSIMANIKNYTLDRGYLPPKLRPIVLPAENVDALPIFSIATLKYTSAGQITVHELDGKATKMPSDGDWAAVGGAWDAFDPFFQRKCNMRIMEKHGLKIDPQITVLSKEAGGLFYHLLHMAGRRAVKLDPVELASIKGYIGRGGFILVEDCGVKRDREFFLSVSAQLQKYFPEGILMPIAPEHPILAGNFPGGIGAIKEAAYTRTVRLLEPDRKAPELFALMINKRPAVIFSKFDLSSAVTGNVYWERWGYGQNTARAILANICMYIRAVKEKKV